MIKIKCIGNLSGDLNLTVGKVYVAVDVPFGLFGDRSYMLINDHGVSSTYRQDFFEKFEEVDQDLTVLRDTYLALLKMPICSWRIQNQKIYCLLRDRIAEKTGKSIQEIQDAFETLAYD